MLTLLEMVSPFWCSLNGGDGGAEAGGDAAAGCRPTTWSLAVLWLVDKEEKRRNAFTYYYYGQVKVFYIAASDSGNEEMVSG